MSESLELKKNMHSGAVPDRVSSRCLLISHEADSARALWVVCEMTQLSRQAPVDDTAGG